MRRRGEGRCLRPGRRRRVARAWRRPARASFFTATLGEALRVRKALGEGPQIFVLNGPTDDDAQHFAGAKLTPVLNSLAQIKLWDARGAARRCTSTPA